MQGRQTLRSSWLPCVQSTTKAQLKTLWLRHVKALFPEEVQDEAAAGASGAGAEVVGGAVRARPGSPNA